MRHNPNSGAMPTIARVVGPDFPYQVVQRGTRPTDVFFSIFGFRDKPTKEKFYV